MAMDTYQKKFLTALALVSALAIIGVTSGEAASCTPGTDCYCDKVKNPSSPLYDPSLLMCEDFEAPTLINNQGLRNGAPWYGPPYDGGTSSPNDRGQNGYWQRNYGNGVTSALWQLNQGSGLGTPCGFSLCTGLKIWSVGDLWGANNYQPIAAFLKNGQYAQEPNLVAPSNASGGGSGTFDGTTSMFHRIPAGNTAGILGQKNFPSKVQTFGITMAVAYAPNIISSLLVTDMWKHNEWNQNLSEAGGDGLFLFGHPGYVTAKTYPFYQFIFNSNSSPDTQAGCLAKVKAATRTVGAFDCDAGSNFIYGASPSNYDYTRDWPLGTWGCVRGYFQNMGTANTSIQILFTGPSGIEQTIVSISGMDTRQTHAGNSPAGYIGFNWNNYANKNQAGAPTNQTSGRYEDNIHIRAGAPISCSQIGANGINARDVAPPTAPVGLRIQ